MATKPTRSKGKDLDKEVLAQIAELTGGLSPTAFTSAWADWAANLSLTPARQAEMRDEVLARSSDTWHFALKALSGKETPPAEGLEVPLDPRFQSQEWNVWPFNVYARAYQNGSSLLSSSVQRVDGVEPEKEKLVQFAVRMVLDATAPTNYLLTNPELLALTQSEKGENIVRGVKNWIEDLNTALDGSTPAGTNEFEVGKQVAITPGKVIYRNGLIELIQYAPSTPDTHAEPLLIVPAWIMKYYILDLSQRNSLVKYLVDQGHTVFMISWKNPDPRDRDLELKDYLNKGFLAAVDAVSKVVPAYKIHAVGYCIGGTLLSIGAAALARDGNARLASITLFAAQTDFSEPGELSYFINPSQLAMLEATMEKKGVLESKQMGGAFALLRSKDLIWQPIINGYIKGKRDAMSDLMAWNADGTRMPHRMHSEYLARLYLNNELATGKFSIDDKAISLTDITVPMFVVGTETDHVAPWTSVYKVGNLVRSNDFSFLLTSGGHNAGIVVGPVHPKRHFRVRTSYFVDPAVAPKEWYETTGKQPGSWWPTWQKWLESHSTGKVKAPRMGTSKSGLKPVCDAPGTYVNRR